MRTALLVILIILAVVLAAVASAGQAINGAWTAEIDGDEIHMSRGGACELHDRRIERGCEVARSRSYAVGWAGPRNRVTPP